MLLLLFALPSVGALSPLPGNRSQSGRPHGAPPAAETVEQTLGVGAGVDQPERDYVPGRILIRLAEGAPAGAAAAAARSVGAGLLRRFASIRTDVWSLGRGVSVEQAVSLLNGPQFRGIVDYAEPDYLVRIVGHGPNDPRRSDLIGFHNLGQFPGNASDADIDGLEAWSEGRRGGGVIVAVVDTGVDYNHPDLAGNILRDGSDNVVGYDYFNNDPDPLDDNNHGSHVAGTIAAEDDNGIGITGVAGDARIMPVKVLGADGSGATSNVISGVNFAASRGAQVINLSLGSTKASNSLKNALANSGAVCCCAAGNSGSSTLFYPAAYDLPNLISVGATDATDGFASFSNYGSWVQVAAPGVWIVSTTRNGNYAMFNGTSMAAPHVSGIAALVKAQNPGWTPAQIKSQILSTVEPLASLAGKVTTGGRVNAALATGGAPALVGHGAPAAVTDLTAWPTPGVNDSLSLHWSAPLSPDRSLAYLYHLRYSQSPLTDEASWEAATPFWGLTKPGTPGTGESPTLKVDLVPGKTYYVAVRGADITGATAPISNVATVEISGGPWTVTVVDDTVDAGYSSPMAFDSQGNPGIAYSDSTNGGSRWVQFNGSTWSAPQVIAPYERGMSFGYSSSDQPGVSFTGGGSWANGPELFFCSRNGAGVWDLPVQVERRYANDDKTSFAWDSQNNPSMTYRLTFSLNDLKFARRINGVWTKQTVDTADGAAYKSLAYTPAGQPAIAYSTTNPSAYFDTLRYAEWNGSAWQVTIIETGVIGYGVWASLAFDPITRQPAIVHQTQGKVRFVRRTAAGWQPAEIVTDGSECTSITFGQDGTAYVSYRLGGEAMCAIRAPGGTWTTEIVEGGANSWYRSTIRVNPTTGRPAITYGSNGALKFVTRNPETGR